MKEAKKGAYFLGVTGSLSGPLLTPLHFVRSVGPEGRKDRGTKEREERILILKASYI